MMIANYRNDSSLRPRSSPSFEMDQKRCHLRKQLQMPTIRRVGAVNKPLQARRRRAAPAYYKLHNSINGGCGENLLFQTHAGRIQHPVFSFPHLSSDRLDPYPDRDKALLAAQVRCVLLGFSIPI
jgi:hypothetical protein